MEQEFQNKLIEKANILIEALPYIQRLSGKTIVVKYGGNAIKSPELTKTILQDITLLKYVGLNPIVVHGGGPEINNYSKVFGVEPKWQNGLRVTDKDTMEVVQLALIGKVNKQIVSTLNSMGAHAIGVSGIDGGLIKVVKKKPVDGVDLGFVGEVTEIDKDLINHLCQNEYIPVIAPIGIDKEGNSYNINADTVAGEIASAIKAEKLMFLTDIEGIRTVPSDPNTLVPVIDVRTVQKYINDGIIDGGMIPKVKACINAINTGVHRTHILDGTVPHPILLEIFTNRGIGTMVVENGDNDYVV
ncbi:MAG: acetylglutamate kinase [Clostridia bacterium]|nr:acetylglutamate kinase [Clostridia bacterium]